MNDCLAVIHLCRVRVTRLDALGFPIGGDDNFYVTDKPMVLTVTPTIEAGQDKTLIGGCDCIIATYRGFDKLKRFELELDLGAFEFGLLEMLLGSAAIVDGEDVIGQWWNLNAFDCSTPAQPNLCFEGWQTGWDEDEQSADHPYMHWIWPSSFWQVAAMTLQNDFNQPKLTAFTRGNSNFGEGPYGDLPEACQPLGGMFYTDTIPTAECGYQTVAPT